MTDEQGHELGPTAELVRLHRVEAAARDLLNRAQGWRSATQLLEGMAALRAALDERPHDDIRVGAHTLMDEAFGHHDRIRRRGSAGSSFSLAQDGRKPGRSR